METRPCQCEHAAHFDDENRLTPRGLPGHEYGREFDPRVLAEVATPYGRFNACDACRGDCLATMGR